MGGRWAVWVVVLAAWLLLPRAAMAAATDDDRCAAVWGLSGLTPTEQARLLEVCRGRGRADASLVPLLSSLTTRATWESASLATILARTGGAHVDVGTRPGHAEQSGRLLALRNELKFELIKKRAGASGRAECGWLRANLDAYTAKLAAGEVPLPPLAGYELADDKCLELDAAAVAEIHFLTISADSAASVAVIAGAEDRALVQWFDASEAIEHDGRKIFVAAVPRFSVVTVVARQRENDLVARWHGFVTRDQTVWDRSPGAGCLRVSIDLDAETTLLLDGQPLTRGKSLAHRTVGVLGGDHELVAMRCAAGGECRVQYRETLAESARTTVRNLCQEIAIDLNQRKSVAVLGAEAAPGCDKGMAFQIGVHATGYLRGTEAETGRVFRDLKAIASLTDALASLRTSLNPTAGEAVGAKTGADSFEQLGSVAKEAWRQGIDSLLSFELRCQANGDKMEYTIVGSKLAVREVLARERGEVAGLDLQRVVVVESMRIHQPAQLAAAVASVVDRLFERGYVRILGDGGEARYRRTIEVEVTAFGDAVAADEVLGAHPQVRAYPLQPDEVGQVCPLLRGALRNREVLGSLAALEKLVRARRLGRVTLRRLDAGTDEANARSVTYVAAVRAASPGPYAVVVSPPGEDVITDAVCVRFEVPRSELWGTVGFASDMTAMSGVREYQWFHARVAAGRTWYRKPWLGVGVAAVYSLGRYIDQDGLPSWQSIDVEPSRSGELFEWTRHAMMVGPVVEVRTRRASWPVELRARLTVVGGLAVVYVGKLPPEFESFITRDPLNNPRLRYTGNLDATLDLGVAYTAGPVVLGPSLFFGAISIVDMFRASTAATALNGAGMVLGLNLSVGGGL
jgi:hypothetical protein